MENIYSLRNSYSIIGLTGRTGSGVSSVANYLSNQTFEDFNPEKPRLSSKKKYNNTHRKYKISYNFLELNWKKYHVIKYSDVIFFHFIRKDITEMIKFTNSFFEDETIKRDFEKFFKTKEFQQLNTDSIELIQIEKKKENEYYYLEKLYNFYFNPKFNKTIEKFNLIFSKFIIERIEFFQTMANNLRQNGCPFKSNCCGGNDNIYTISKTINKLIKSYKRKNKSVHIVIDSLRNSLEIMFFKERYSAFYMMSVSSDTRRYKLNIKYKSNKEIVKRILEIDQEEYDVTNFKKGQYFTQDVQNCIQKSDIHLTNNLCLEDRTKCFSDNEIEVHSSINLKKQIVKFCSLILHPGLTTPSAQERCMQIAFNAKSNSGCISRQVGAVITDEFFSVKSIGWNDVPKHHTPCLLRNVEDLINRKDSNAFSSYEKEENKEEFEFFETIENHYKDVDFKDFNGLNCSFCFKDVQNKLIDKGANNQVHTRSLHAEENAMLQITKYGGQQLKNGILFTTASPCELCSKKAKQLEIDQIYYIDPYPGIAKAQILNDGKKNIWPNYILFSGAVGRAFHKLYEPIMSYKDEIAIVSKLNLKR